MKNKEKAMRLQLLNKQIIDEREEGLAHKAGAETAGFLLFEKSSKKAQKNHFLCYTVIENFLI